MRAHPRIEAILSGGASEAGEVIYLEPERRRPGYVIDPSGCWVWVGAFNNKGYGTYGRDGFRLAHRWMYTTFKGPIAPGMTIDHLCRNRACVNPDHLESVTLRENLMRAPTLQFINARKTHCLRGHPFSPENTVVKLTRGGVGRMRQCRQCNALRRRGDVPREHGCRAFCRAGHLLTEDNVYGRRALCKTCHREANRAQRRRATVERATRPS